MATLYNLLLHLASFILKCIAPLNLKIKKGVEGRAQTFDRLKKFVDPTHKYFWFHCASLGEYEQGLPVFKALRKNHPQHKFILTFFSPSGYEIRKNTEVADLVLYLPLDTPAHAQKFVEMFRPELTIFVKYEIWPNYLRELEKRNLRTLLISATFRPDQSYFKWYGSLMRNALKSFDHIFVQEETSLDLLKQIKINDATVAGDTRYDRVHDQLAQNNALTFIEEFKNNNLCVVIGSSWPEDDALIIPYINQMRHGQVKFIIAPHNIKGSQIDHYCHQINKKTVLYSQKEEQKLSQAQVFIIDTIGLLSKIYSYADMAYVGGAMGKTGLHNILEPAVFGVPVVIGKNYEKFPEAGLMIKNAGVISVKNEAEFSNIFDLLITDQVKRKELGLCNAQFINNHRHAVDKIMNYLKN